MVNIKKVLFFIICFLSFINIGSCLELTTGAKSAILIEASTGEVLYEYNADESLPMASMTKIMTLLLTMEAIETGTISLDDTVTVSENAASMGGSQVYLDAGSTYKLEDIIKAVCIASGNDAAVVLAETIGGSEANFVSMMNEKAKNLGLTGTNFVNVYGLDADGHFSTARDMAIMARELVKHEKILEYSSIYEEYLNKPDGSSIWMVNTNKLVRFFSGVDGLKTGYTGNAGYCLTATGKWNDMRLISVVMGEESQDDRSDDTIALLNYGKGSFKLNTVITSNEVLGEANIELGEVLTQDIVIEEDITDLIKIGDNDPDYSYELKLNKITAPVKKGEIVGTIYVYDGDELIKETTVTVKEDVNKVSFFKDILRVLCILVSGTN